MVDMQDFGRFFQVHIEGDNLVFYDEKMSPVLKVDTTQKMSKPNLERIINEAMGLGRNRTWEYCTVFITPEEDMRKVINQYGSEGWFVCGQDADDANKYYFRR